MLKHAVLRSSFALSLIAFAFAPVASAGTLTGQLQISVVVEPTCSINSVGSVVFGAYNAVAGNTLTYNFAIDCDANVQNATIAFSSPNVHPSVPTIWRMQAGNGNTLDYTIRATDTQISVSDSVPESLTVTGGNAPAAQRQFTFKVPPNQVPTTVGEYSDIMLVTYQFN